jgi:hypothetical protein
MKKENILNYSFYTLFAILFIWNIYLLKNNPSYKMYGKISQERQKAHIQKLDIILDNVRDYRNDKEFNDNVKLAKYVVYGIRLKDADALKARLALYNIAIQYHNTIKTEPQGVDRFAKHDMSHTFLAIAHTADYIATGNIASFVNAEHDIQHAFTKDLLTD